MDWRKRFCKLGFHNWSETYAGIRVCLRKGCTRIDLYYGITGMLRYMREHYTEKQLKEMIEVKD